MVTSVLGGGVEFIMIYFLWSFYIISVHAAHFFCIDYINENALFTRKKWENNSVIFPALCYRSTCHEWLNLLDKFYCRADRFRDCIMIAGPN